MFMIQACFLTIEHNEVMRSLAQRWWGEVGVVGGGNNPQYLTGGFWEQWDAWSGSGGLIITYWVS